MQISLILGAFMFLFMIINWRERNLRYQLTKSIGLLFFLVYITFIGCVNLWTGVKGGRWWYCFPVFTVAANDSAAYFAGRLLGRHHLIGISPNKTIEGFVGGFFANIVITYIAASWCLSQNFWQCPPEHYNYKLFEDFQCETALPMYSEKEY